MRKHLLFAVAILVLAPPFALLAQDNPTPKAEHHAEAPAAKETNIEGKPFRMNFVVKQLEDGKVTNIRSYSSLANTQGKSLNLRTSSDANGLETRISIDTYAFSVKENEITFTISIDLGDMSKLSTDTPGATNSTIMNQNRWSSTVKIISGKSTVIYSADNPASKKSIQLEVTATLL